MLGWRFMKMIQILRASDRAVVTTSLEAIANNCECDVNELEIMRVLREMNTANEITIIPAYRNH
jgi:hypothetical protein